MTKFLIEHLTEDDTSHIDYEDCKYISEKMESVFFVFVIMVPTRIPKIETHYEKHNNHHYCSYELIIHTQIPQ